MRPPKYLFSLRFNSPGWEQTSTSYHQAYDLPLGPAASPFDERVFVTLRCCGVKTVYDLLTRVSLYAEVLWRKNRVRPLLPTLDDAVHYAMFQTMECSMPCFRRCSAQCLVSDDGLLYAMFQTMQHSMPCFRRCSTLCHVSDDAALYALFQTMDCSMPCFRRWTALCHVSDDAALYALFQTMQHSMPCFRRWTALCHVSDDAALYALDCSMPCFRRWNALCHVSDDAMLYALFQTMQHSMPCFRRCSTLCLVSDVAALYALFQTMQQCSRHSTVCWLLVLGCVWAVACQLRPVMAKPSPDSDQMAAMADALKYLQDLDRYYSQVARPR
uniref:Uncharacterized protein n=1 Tax=Timema douglasi TaxID=61478 RepID=A0A7R8VR71_TIMDO|nr:unnamed protein product [Timema douglasi]